MLGCKTLNSSAILVFSCHSLPKWHSSSRHQPPTKKKNGHQKKKGRQKNSTPTSSPLQRSLLWVGPGAGVSRSKSILEGSSELKVPTSLHVDPRCLFTSLGSVDFGGVAAEQMVLKSSSSSDRRQLSGRRLRKKLCYVGHPYSAAMPQMTQL